MLKRIRHKGLAALHMTGSTKGVPAALAEKIELILDRLDFVAGPQDFGFGYKLHPLKGYWAVHVSANWRIISRFERRRGRHRRRPRRLSLRPITFGADYL